MFLIAFVMCSYCEITCFEIIGEFSLFLVMSHALCEQKMKLKAGSRTSSVQILRSLSDIWRSGKEIIINAGIFHLIATNIEPANIQIAIIVEVWDNEAIVSLICVIS